MRFAATLLREDGHGGKVPCHLACRIKAPDGWDPNHGPIQSHVEVRFGGKWRRVWIGGHDCLTFVHLWHRQVPVDIRRVS